MNFVLVAIGSAASGEHRAIGWYLDAAALRIEMHASVITCVPFAGIICSSGLLTLRHGVSKIRTALFRSRLAGCSHPSVRYCDGVLSTLAYDCGRPRHEVAMIA